MGVNREARESHSGYRVVDALEFEVESSLRPFIGVPPDSPEEVVSFLEAEGHIVERSLDKHSYGVYLEETDVSEESAKRAMIDRIEGSDAPLVRSWRWPNGARSCLAVTGDIDCVTLVDFIMRPFEV